MNNNRQRNNNVQYNVDPIQNSINRVSGIHDDTVNHCRSAMGIADQFALNNLNNIAQSANYAHQRTELDKQQEWELAAINRSAQYKNSFNIDIANQMMNISKQCSTFDKK